MLHLGCILLKLHTVYTIYRQAQTTYKALMPKSATSSQIIRAKLENSSLLKGFLVIKFAIQRFFSGHSLQIGSVELSKKLELNALTLLSRPDAACVASNIKKRSLTTRRQCNRVMKNYNLIVPSRKRMKVARFSSQSGGDKDNNDKPGRHCYHKQIEKTVNHQILKELNAGYAYLSMACYFGHTEIAFPGSQGFFLRMHEEEHGHAMKLINYQLQRGGLVELYPLTIPECQNWEGIEKAIAIALDMEKIVKESLLELYRVAEKHGDTTTMNLMEDDFIKEQERSICELARLLKRIKCLGSTDVGEFLFDKEMHKAFVKKAPKVGIDVSGSSNKLYL